MSIFDEHRRLILGVTFVVLLVLALRFVVIPRAEKRRADARTKMNGQMAKFNDAYVHPARPHETVMREINSDINSRQKKIIATKKKVGWKWPEYVSIPEKHKDNPGVQFREQWLKLKEELESTAEDIQRRRRQERKVLHELEFKADPLLIKGEKGTLEYLRMLAVMERILRLALKMDAISIVKVTPKPEKEEGVRGQEVEDNGRETRPLTHPFIYEYPVEIELVASLDNVMKFLRSLQKEGEGGQYLAISRFTVMSRQVLSSKYVDEEIRDRAKEYLKEDNEHYVIIEATGMDFMTPEVEAARRQEIAQGEDGRQALSAVKVDVKHLQPAGH